MIYVAIEDSDQSRSLTRLRCPHGESLGLWRMRRLLRVFAGHTCHLVDLAMSRFTKDFIKYYCPYLHSLIKFSNDTEDGFWRN